jgi:uncharacterized membrane protein YfcA
MRPVRRTEQLVRSVILLSACALFSSIAYLAGAYNFTDQKWTIACVAGVVIAAVIVSRLGAKLVMRRVANSQSKVPSNSE